MRLPTLELGAGDTADMDFDVRNDIRPCKGINLLGNILTLSLAPNTYAVIKMNHVIEHFSPAEQKQVLASVHHWLAPGGLFLCWTPDRDWMEWARDNGLITKEWYDTLTTGKGDYAENVHHGLLTQAQMRELMAEAGLAVHSVREVGGSIEAVAFKEG